MIRTLLLRQNETTEKRGIQTMKRSIALIVCLLLLIAAFPVAALADGPDLEVNALHFPDENFRKYLVDQGYTSGNASAGYTISQSKLEWIRGINVSDRDISDLTGIEYFPNLIELYCASCKLTFLDVSENKLLRVLDCSGNQLTSLNVISCANLEKLNCTNNKLSSLYVTYNTALKELSCVNNQLTVLDLTMNDRLVKLYCGGNKLTALNLTHAPNLEELSVGDNQLTQLDLSKNTALKTIDCVRAQLSSLDLSHNKELTSLNCSSNNLTALDLSKNTKLTSLSCVSNQLSSLDLSHNPLLYSVNCYQNALTSLNVSNLSALTQLNCKQNRLSSLNLADCTALTQLDCQDNRLSSLNVSGNAALKSLSCDKNELNSLDISHNPEINSFSCRNNHLTTLDLDQAQNPKLTWAYCSTQTLPGQRFTHEKNGWFGETGYYFNLKPLVKDLSKIERVNWIGSAHYDEDTGMFAITEWVESISYEYDPGIGDESLHVQIQFVKDDSETKPVITTQPKDVTAEANATAKFTVVASNATSYQWQWSSDGGKTWSNSSSATTGYNAATLQVKAETRRNGYMYRCQVTNEAGTVTSSAATLTVNVKPVITTQPKDVTAEANATAKFTVVASNATSYQWQWSSDGGKTWSNSSSATTGYNAATLQVKAEARRNGYMYRCQVSNSAGTVTSSAATLTVSSSKPTITTQPKSVTTSAGSTAKFTVAASGTGLKYQWQWSFDGGKNWQNSSSATTGYNTATLQVTATEARNGYQYRCQVSNSAGSVTTSAATLTVVTKPTITTQPKSVTAAVNATAKFTVAASGTGLKYQWQWSFDGGKNWSNSSSATVGYNTATLQVTATEARNGYQYRCQVTNEAGAVTSSAATLTVSSSKPTITTQPKSVTAAVNTTAKFTVEATNATSYQWQWSFDGGSNWQNSSSATTGYNTATLQVTATETRNGYMYRCKVTNSAGTVTSSAATLTVVTKPTITTQPKSVTTSAGSTAKFTVAASGTGLKYQWQWSFDGGNNWQNSSSATTGYNTATLQVTATEARNGYMYRCKVTNSAGTVYTNAVTLTVK